ncbi:MAG TPA: TonB-dependent receptor [Saprospiraceae bacterium]|nr:TonB-dependent receptor [Saprospiraceae bacterium]HND88141.1 TonB-dependent receptor [Saprospiraceae bacterium]
MHILETEQKALEINLDERIYGAFAEIGAGQEVARHFFQVGAAAGTIAKTMSAYDKTVSDEIYGPEPKGRYVCEARLYKMLEHEYALMEGRLRTQRPHQNFFAFADTVSAINYAKTNRGNGWLGLRFQLHPDAPPNDLVLHVRLLDHDNRLQQQAIGILGVNMIYGCYRHHHQPEMLLQSLLDNLRGRVDIDLVRASGPDFAHVDNRLLCLWAVKHGLTDVAMFGPDGSGLHASEFLYRKSVLIARGSYRPPTLVQQDMIREAYAQFRSEPDVDADKTFFLTEITLDNLRADGQISERDFLDRAEILCALGQTVIISNCLQHKKLIAYFSEYRVARIGLAMGARKLQNIIWETFQQHPDNLLGAFGALFLQNVRFYIYPARRAEHEPLLSSTTIEIPPAIRFLYDHLLANHNIVDIHRFRPDILHIYHKTVYSLIQRDLPGWPDMLPPEVARIIQERGLFGHRNSTEKEC